MREEKVKIEKLLEQLVKETLVGFEITFSNDDLKLMRLDDTQYNYAEGLKDAEKKVKKIEEEINKLINTAKNLGQKALVDKNDLSQEAIKAKKQLAVLKSNFNTHSSYCKYIHNTYLTQWKQFANKNTTCGNFSLVKVEDEESKMKENEGKMNGKYPKMMVRFYYVKQGCKFKEGEKVVRKEGEKQDEEEGKEKEKEQPKEKGTAKEPDELIQWSWCLDVDESCLEVHASPLTRAEYDNKSLHGNGVSRVIQEHIYDIAHELNLNAGKKGMGGGHLSVDMATGFDNDPQNIFRTILLWEILKNKIDACGAHIDVEDNVNAAYFYDGTRDKYMKGNMTVKTDNDGKLSTTLADIVYWLTSWDKECKNNSEKTNPGEREDPISKALFFSDFADWKSFKQTFSEVLCEHPIPEHEDRMKGLKWNQKERSAFKSKILHYHNINIEHVTEVQPKDRRVEFRRFVSQRNYSALMDNIDFLLALIACARVLGMPSKVELYERLRRSVSCCVLSRPKSS